MVWDGLEKRHVPRGQVHCKIFVYTADSRIFSAFTENISEGGLRALFDERLEVASIINLEIYLHNDDAFACKGKVIWANEVRSEQEPAMVFYDTGIEFLRE